MSATATLLDPYAWACKGTPLKVFSEGAKNARQGIITSYQRLSAVISPKQAVVKVTSFRGGMSGVGQVINYVSRDATLELHGPNDLVYKGKQDIEGVLESWSADFSKRKNARDVMHMVVSTPIGTDRKAAAEAGKAFARDAFGHNHDYLIVAHDDEEHPHSHIIVKMRGMDGERLRTEKADLRQWRYQFAEACVEQGINVSASPRYVRGRVRRSTPSKLWHLHSKGVSRVVQLAVKDAIGIITSSSFREKRLQEMPWIEKVNIRFEKENDAFKTLQDEFTEKIKAAAYNKKSNIHDLRDAIKSHREKFIEREPSQRKAIMNTANEMFNDGLSQSESASRLEVLMVEAQSAGRNAALNRKQQKQHAIKIEKIREQDQGWEQ